MKGDQLRLAGLAASVTEYAFDVTAVHHLITSARTAETMISISVA